MQLNDKQLAVLRVNQAVQAAKRTGLDREALADLMASAQTVMSDMMIEMFTIPSPDPGVSGNPGASPQQLAVRDAFFSGQYRFVACAGANQSGKTVAVAGAFCEFIRDHARSGDIFWLIAQSSETIRDVPQRSLWEMLPRSMFPRDRTYDPKLGFGSIPTLKLKLPDRPGHCEIWFKTEEMELKKFESSRLRGVWWTECTREKIFDALQPRLLKFNGFMLMDYVPTESWHKTRLRLATDTETKWFKFCTKDNAHNMPPGSIEKMRARLTARDAKVRIDGEEGSWCGAVYREFEPDKHVVKSFIIPDDWPMWVAVDYGHRNPNAAIFCAVSPEEVLYVFDEDHRHSATVMENCESILAKIERHGGMFRFEDSCALIDPSTFNKTVPRGENQISIADLFMDEGLPVTRGIRTQTMTETAMVAKVQRWFENGKIKMFDRCEETIREHLSWKYKEDRDGEARKNEPFEDKDNHTCDCLKMIIGEEPVYYTGGAADVVSEELAYA